MSIMVSELKKKNPSISTMTFMIAQLKMNKSFADSKSIRHSWACSSTKHKLSIYEATNLAHSTLKEYESKSVIQYLVVLFLF